MKGWRRHNFIDSISSEHSLIKSVWEVKEEVMRHFYDEFMEPDLCRLTLNGIGFKRIEIEIFQNIFFKVCFRESFYFLYYKASVSSCKEIEIFQNRFIWGGLEDKKKIY